jgi:uncharacterized protein
VAHSTSESRIAFLDILRGICICFIFFANLPIFSGYVFLSPEVLASFSTAGLDELFGIALKIFIDGKFYTLFSLLFGIGMVIQYKSFGKDIEAFRTYMRKRLAILLLIGIFHLWVLWVGDILTIYALLGLLVLCLFHWSSKTLLIVGVTFILLPVAHIAILNVFDSYTAPMIEFVIRTNEQLGVPKGTIFEQAFFIQQTESLALYADAKFYDPIVRIALVLEEGRLYKVFGIICIGLVAGRHILQYQLLSNKGLLKKIMLWGFAVGLPANIAYAKIDVLNLDAPLEKLIGTILYAIGVVPLAFAYAAGLALLLSGGIGRLGVFSSIGRMALSNYIMQTVLALFIFNGISLGMSGKIGLTSVWGIGLCVIIFQVWFSTQWLSKFKQGPLEFIWRKVIPK